MSAHKNPDDAAVDRILAMSDEEIREMATRKGICLECSGWGFHGDLNHDYPNGPLWLNERPCDNCSGTGRVAPAPSA